MVAHGMAMHGEPKYPANAATPDYVNPNAPKGGAVKFGAVGASTFDSCILSSSRAYQPRRSAHCGSRFAGMRATKAFSIYGLIAETIEWPEDRSWVAFNLRPEAKWHDGSPITVEDVSGASTR
jgi:microcin C transport system substrate-binding protein